MTDDMDFLDNAQPVKAARLTSRNARSGFRAEDEKTTARATGKKKGSWAGRYKRSSFPILPEVLSEIDRQARLHGVSKNDLVRWFVDRGLEDLRKGVKPPVEDVVVRRRIAKK